MKNMKNKLLRTALSLVTACLLVLAILLMLLGVIIVYTSPAAAASRPAIP